MNDKQIKVNNCAEAYLELLRAKGVKYFFINPGSDTAPINDAFLKLKIEGKNEPKLILVPHENAATSMAYGYTMVTGEPQVVMVHVMVGTANALGAVINASSGKVPIIFTAGRSSITEEGLSGCRDINSNWNQESYDQGSILREFVKWDYELRTPEQISPLVNRAFKIALTEPQGPVYLILPREWLMAKMQTVTIPSIFRHKPSSPPSPSMEELKKIVKILMNASNPLIITGWIGRKPEAVNKLVILAELLSIPVVERPRFRMNFPTDHPLHLGFETHSLIKDADVILLIDTDIPWVPAKCKPKEEAIIIKIDTDPNCSSLPIWGFPIDISVTAESNITLPLLINQIKKNLEYSKLKQVIKERFEKTFIQHQQQRKKWKQEALKMRNNMPINFLWLSHLVNEIIDENTIIINEYDLRPTQVTLNVPGSFFGTPPSAHLGIGLGSALGAKLAYKKKTVLACLGDGSYMFNNPVACHWTSNAHNLPILIILFNNSSYGFLRRNMSNLLPNGWSSKYKKYLGVDLDPSIDFAGIARSAGGYGETVENPDELKSALIRGLKIVKEKKKQALINVICEKPVC